MKIPSFLKSTAAATTVPPPPPPPPKEISVNAVVGRQWRKWPSCNYPDTLSFRSPSSSFDGIFKTLNSIYFHDVDHGLLATEDVPDFVASDEILFSADSDSEDDSETVVRGIRSSDRLFFDPDQISSAILLRKTEEEAPEAEEEADKAPPPPPTKGFPFEESVVLAMESEDPYLDFRRSMEEMVEFQGIDCCKDWGRLEELLQWYLNVNGKKNHGFIVGAFLDLLVGISGGGGGGGCAPTSGCDSFSSAVTCLSPSRDSCSTTTNSDSSSPLFYPRG